MKTIVQIVFLLISSPFIAIGLCIGWAKYSISTGMDIFKEIVDFLTQ